MDANVQSLSPCDVVMKGGITSGVVYPALVVKLAENYQFKSIGGTSAGAIAAACAAAAEHGRQHNNANAISDLDQLSSDLGAPGFILGLFKPTIQTRPLFNVAIDAIGNAWLGLKILKAIWAAMLGFWPLTLIGLALDALIGWWLWSSGVHDPVVWALAVVSWLVVLGVAWALGVWWSISRAVPKNYLGLCNGSEASPTKNPPLTDWLAAKIDHIAGTNDPLTFGDLWGRPPAQAQTPTKYSDLQPYFDEPTQSLDEIRGDAEVDLQMMTTCVSLGRPYRLPFAQRDFYLDPADARVLFPEPVYKWLLKYAAQPRSKYEAILYRALLPKVPLPLAACFPVVVAARMSLSFPVLLSAFRLYHIDFGLQDNKDATAAIKALVGDKTFDLDAGDAANRLVAVKEKLLARPCWFSDGGLTHNFPVHFFDRPLPSWPTFAVDLEALPEGRTEHENDNQSTYVWLPKGNLQGIQPFWNRIEDRNGRASFYNFVTSIVDTMMNWTDSTQAVMPGYRDRIAHVELAQNEGGLNLNMQPKVVEKLIARGRAAGVLLHDEFGAASGSQPHWLNHRWVRYRSFMDMYERLLTAFHAGYPETSTQPTYPALIARAQGADPTGYPWVYPAQSDFAVTTTKKIDDLAGEIASAETSYMTGAPRPQGELAMRPVL